MSSWGHHPQLQIVDIMSSRTTSYNSSPFPDCPVQVCLIQYNTLLDELYEEVQEHLQELTAVSSHCLQEFIVTKTVKCVKP